MRRIAVRTGDFRLSFHLIRELKRRNCEFVMLSPEQSWDGIYLTSPEEATDGGIPALEDNVEIAVERAIQASRGVDKGHISGFWIRSRSKAGVSMAR